MSKTLILTLVISIILGGSIVYASSSARYIDSLQVNTSAYTLNEMGDASNPGVHCYVLTSNSNGNNTVMSCVYIPTSNQINVNPTVYVAPATPTTVNAIKNIKK